MSTTDPILSAQSALFRASHLARAALHTLEGADLCPLGEEFGDDRQHAAEAVAELLRLIRDGAQEQAESLMRRPLGGA